MIGVRRQFLARREPRQHRHRDRPRRPRAFQIVQRVPDQRDLLRLRPDRIIIGEVRDGSALDLLKAWNTGHPGGLATIHANSAAEALTRLEDLIGEVTQRVPYRAITQAINVVVYIERTATGRRIRDVSRLVGREQDGYVLAPVAAPAR